MINESKDWDLSEDKKERTMQEETNATDVETQSYIKHLKQQVDEGVITEKEANNKLKLYEKLKQEETNDTNVSREEVLKGLQEEENLEGDIMEKLRFDSRTLNTTFIFHSFGNEGYLLNTRTGEMKYICSSYVQTIGTKEEYHQSDKYKQLQDEQSKRKIQLKEAHESIKKDQLKEDKSSLVSGIEKLIGKI